MRVIVKTIRFITMESIGYKPEDRKKEQTEEMDEENEKDEESGREK